MRLNGTYPNWANFWSKVNNIQIGHQSDSNNFYVYHGSPTDQTQAFNNFTIPTDQWNTFVLTYDGTNAILYIDSADNNQSVAIGSVTHTSSDLRLGSGEANSGLDADLDFKYFGWFPDVCWNKSKVAKFFSSEYQFLKSKGGI